MLIRFALLTQRLSVITPKASWESKKTTSMGGSLQKAKSYYNLDHLLARTSAHLFAFLKQHLILEWGILDRRALQSFRIEEEHQVRRLF